MGIGIIVERGGKVLLGLRQGSHGAGEWAFPGGGLEFLETPDDCALRELAEEAGLEARNPRRLAYWTDDHFPADGKHYITLYLRVDADDALEPVVCEPEKCERWDFFDWDALPEPVFPGVRAIAALRAKHGTLPLLD